MRIIGITGTTGAGKGTVVDYLTSRGFKHHSARSLLLRELKNRGLPEDRPSMISIGNELRREHGNGYIAEQLFEEAESGGTDAVIESIRSLGEVESLRRLSPGAILLAVDADLGTRYERIKGRARETDNVTLEEFTEHERGESEGKDPWKQNLPACIKAADVVLMNDGTKEELFAQVEKLLTR